MFNIIVNRELKGKHSSIRNYNKKVLEVGGLLVCNSVSFGESSASRRNISSKMP
jgi:hypothetical protein